MSDRTTYKLLQNKWLEMNNIVAGTQLKVVSKAVDFQLGWNNSWAGPSMDRSIGKTFIFKSCSETGVQFVGEHYSYPFFVLEVVPPNVSIKIGQINGYILPSGDVSFSGYTFKQSTIEKVKNALKSPPSRYCVEPKSGNTGFFAEKVIKEIELKLNDGRKITWTRTQNTLGSVFVWSCQPEGLAYWIMADTLFTVGIKNNITSKVIDGILITTDGSIKYGCKTFSLSEVQQFIDSYYQFSDSTDEKQAPVPF